MTESRIPTYNENAAAWAQAMCAAGLAYHLEDDPADIVILDGQDRNAELPPFFTKQEAEELRNIVARMDGDEMEVCFGVFLQQFEVSQALHNEA